MQQVIDNKSLAIIHGIERFLDFHLHASILTKVTFSEINSEIKKWGEECRFNVEFSAFIREKNQVFNALVTIVKPDKRKYWCSGKVLTLIHGGEADLMTIDFNKGTCNEQLSELRDRLEK